ncbi:MAG TPA: hypothetical protein VGR24_00775 [bacterium]|jgi:DNA polymerase-4|nr:hypothetical protein [bacterium]
MDRQIVCVSIPSFEIALARLEDSALRARPVAVAAATHPRAVLRDVSAEAAGEGLCPGMAVDHARWLCPSIHLLPPSPARIRRGQQQVQEIISRFAPVWETFGPGHLFLDLTGTHRLFGRAVDAAAQIGREVAQRHALAAALAVGTNKLVTQVATGLIKPADLYDVQPGRERRFMAPLPPLVLPELARPAGRPLISLLEDLNVPTLGAIAAVPLDLLRRVVGSTGYDLHRHAQGIDDSPVLAARSRPRLTESLILDPDSVDLKRIRADLFTLVERIGNDLRERHHLCRRLRVTVVYSDFIESSREADIRPETNLDAALYDAAQPLLTHAFGRRVRVRRLILEAAVGLRPAEQLPLFDFRSGTASVPRSPDPDRVRRLNAAVDRIRRRYGERAVRWGRTVRAP